MNDIYDNAAKNAISLVNDILNTYGPRVSGTKSNYAAVDELERIVNTTCTSTRRERFDLYPGSLFSIAKIFTIQYIIGLLTILSNKSIMMCIGTVCMLFGIVYCISQFILYSDKFDRLFKKVTGNNIVGYLEPKNEAKEQIILVGHHDSSYIYSFHEKFPLLFPIRLFTPIIMYLFELFILLVALVLGFSISIPIWIKITVLAGLVFVIPMFWYISKKPGPGAGDNLIGCTIGLSILESIKGKLKSTRLLLLLTDGEEIGQKGARHFINSNIEELRAIKTKVINIDSIYTKDDVAILRSDRNGFSKLSSTLSERLKKIAVERGYNPKIISMPFGGGGTDGCQFAMKGFETTSIIGMPTDLIRKDILIHTTKDLPDRINLDAVSLVIEMVSEYIKINDIEAES